MSEMVERVAVAILKEWLIGAPETFPRGVLQKFGAEILARAAIQAMREPTEAMILEGFSDDACREGDVTQAWRHMIDAALKDNP